MTVVSSQAGLAIPLEDQQLIGTMPEIWSPILSSFQLCVSSGQSLDRLGNRGDMRDDSAEILFESFLQEALVSGSRKCRDVHSLMLPIQHFLFRPRRRPPPKVPWRMFLERLSWCVTCPSHASFRLLTVVRRGSCGPTRKVTLLRPIDGVVLQVADTKKFPQALGFGCQDPFLSQHAWSLFHSHRRGVN